MKKKLFQYSGLPVLKGRPLGLIVLALFMCQSIFAQEITVSGSVSSKDGGPLIGASVLIKGTATGVLTDDAGRYSLTAPSSGTLVFRYTGFDPQEVSINNQTTINVVMTGDLTLEEVVVIGYGTQNKESVTGSVVSIKGDDLNQVQVSNFQEALQGRAAGVDISSTSTRPGASPQVRIRGVRSLSANNDPLIVLNGIPFSGGLSDINSNDIGEP
ncbi:MAG: carboxypeptidase-like regulatory domain-containing protein [Bacteroidia bacterium]